METFETSIGSLFNGQPFIITLERDNSPKRVVCSNTFKTNRKNKMRNDRKFKNQKQSRNFF